MIGSPKRMLMALFWFAAGFLVLTVGWPYAMQRKMIYPAPAGPIPENLGAGVEQVPLSEGLALLAHPTNKAHRAPLIVFTHGNAELAHWSIDSFRYFRDRGVAILLVEYPGYGGTPGSPTSDSIESTVLEAMDRVKDRQEIDPDRVIAYGRSIGTGAALLLASQRQVSALILESPFVSLKQLVADLGYPSFLLKDRFNNASIISSLDMPIFLYHGLMDSIIPHDHSERLLALAPHASLVSADCGHNDCPRPWRQVHEFLSSHGILSPG